jgi:hypothetical protein
MIYSPQAALQGSRSRPAAERRATRIALALCSGLAIALGACERESATSVAVRDAEAKIHALTPAGAQPVSVAYRQKTYNEIKTSLQKANTGTTSENAAAAVLLAQSTAGLAQIPAAEAADLFHASLHEQAQARSVLSRWLTHMALADAAAKFSPAKELADLDADIAKVDQALAAAQQKKSQIDKQVADLQAQAKQKSDQAAALRQQGGALKAGIPNATAVQGSEILKQSRDIGRQADALEVAAADFDARAQQIAPTSGETQLDIDKLNLQKQLLNEGKAGVQKRADDARQQAKESRTRADEVLTGYENGEYGHVKGLDEFVKGLLDRQEQIKAKTDEATAGYASAAKAAKSAATELRGTAQMALGSALQSSGDASWTLAQSYATLADTLESIAKAAFAPANASELTGKAAEARTAGKAALDAATEAYQGALDAYQKAGAKAQAAEVMEKLTSGLKKSVTITSGGSVDLGEPEKAPETPKPADTGAPAAAAPAGDASGPQATLQAMIDASKAQDYDKLADLFAADTPEQKQGMKALFALAPRFKALNAAMKAKFGSGMEGMAGASGMGAPEVGDMDKLNAADIKVEVSGDSATAKVPGGKDLAMKKVDGKWLIDLSSMGASPQQMAMAGAMAPALGKAVDEVTADVNSGKIPTAQAAQMALMGKLMKAGGGMPGGKPGGGG